MHPCTHSSTHPHHPVIHPSPSTTCHIYPCIHPSTQSMHPPIHPSTHPPIHPSTHPPIESSTHRLIHSPTHPLTHSLTDRPIHPPTHAHTPGVVADLAALANEDAPKYKGGAKADIVKAILEEQYGKSASMNQTSNKLTSTQLEKR